METQTSEGRVRHVSFTPSFISHCRFPLITFVSHPSLYELESFLYCISWFSLVGRFHLTFLLNMARFNLLLFRFLSLPSPIPLFTFSSHVSMFDVMLSIFLLIYIYISLSLSLSLLSLSLSLSLSSSLSLSLSLSLSRALLFISLSTSINIYGCTYLFYACSCSSALSYFPSLSSLEGRFRDLTVCLPLCATSPASPFHAQDLQDLPCLALTSPNGCGCGCVCVCVLVVGDGSP